MTIKLPPPEIRRKVSNTPDEKEYLMVGSRSASTIRQVLGNNSYDLGSFNQILDFACGCGRTLNFMRFYVSTSRLYGCDYDPELVSWCNRNFDMAGCIRNEDRPGTDFPDSFFDFIYSISFFTHLSEGLQLEWLQEWKRILKDDGLIFLTLHGIELAKRSGVRIPKTGFVHLIQGQDFNRHVTYQTREYVERKWSGIFDILYYQVRGLADHQDVVLLGGPGSIKHKKAVTLLNLPPELLAEYQKRSDLKALFDENGVGRPTAAWRNLNLMDWALFYGGYEVPSLQHLCVEDFYQIVTGE